MVTIKILQTNAYETLSPTCPLFRSSDFHFTSMSQFILDDNEARFKYFTLGSVVL